MAICNITYRVTGTLTGAATGVVGNNPISGISARSVAIDVSDSVYSKVMSVETGTATTVFSTSSFVESDLTHNGALSLIIFISSVDGMLAWKSDLASADNCSVKILAGVPFILSNPHVAPHVDLPTYTLSSWPYDTVVVSTDNVASIFTFKQSSGSASKMTVLAFGADE